jgi:glycosyltransferase involved in cell wall biosynthesis
MCKVCHITTVHPTFDARIFYKECKTLVQAGYNVSLISQHNLNESVDGVRIIPLPRIKNRFKRRTKLVWKAFILALKENADIYHFHDPELISIGILLKLFRKKVVYDIHEYYSEIVPLRCNIKTGFLYLFIKFIVKLFIEYIPSKIFNLIVFPTYSLEKEYNIPHRSIVLVNFPNIKSIKDEEKFLDQKKKIYDIIHVGTISPPRMKFMLEVTKELSKSNKKFKWLFLGISKHTINWVLKNYDKKFINEYIIMKTRVPYLEALEYISESCLGFNYHPYEKRFLVAIPMKVFEYMINDIPVVTTALPELKFYLKNNINALLVDSQDPVEYCEAIKLLLNNSNKALNIAIKGKKLITEKLNWESSESKKLIKAYESLIKYGD